MLDKDKFKKCSTPFSDEYHPELDESPLCDEDKVSKYKSLIGSANWIITLGHFDIAFAVSTLSRFTMAPRKGHFLAWREYLDTYMPTQMDTLFWIPVKPPLGVKLNLT